MKRVFFGVVLIILCAVPSFAGSVTVNYVPGTTYTTTALTGFSTFGDQMAGMKITAYFTAGGSETVTWVATGAGAGNAIGTGWSLAESGDTFNNSWELIQNGSLSGLKIEAGPGNTTFDTWTSPEGTPGSGSGIPFTVTSGGTFLDIAATYSNLLGVAPNPPVGDEYLTLALQFRYLNGYNSSTALFFDADTDNILYAGDLTPVPEPASLLLLGSGLAGVLFRLRRR